MIRRSNYEEATEIVKFYSRLNGTFSNVFDVWFQVLTLIYVGFSLIQFVQGMNANKKNTSIKPFFD